jgi:hypothetical protein
MLTTQPVPIINEIKNTKLKTYNANLQQQIQEYDVTEGLFDPSKCSPPNEFMLKLYMRMMQHTNIFQKNEENRESE